MEKITTLSQLNEAILLLEIQQRDCSLELTTEVKKSIGSFSPGNALQQGLGALVKGGTVKSILISSAITLVTGYISKKFLTPATVLPIRRMMGIFLQIGAPQIVVNKNQVFVAEQSVKASDKFIKS